MASNTFQSKIVKPVPPDKGSFPIDHEGECQPSMIAYLKCLRNNNFKSEKCRLESMQYLECRMDKGLMARETWDTLGFADLECDNNNSSSSKAPSAQAG